MGLLSLGKMQLPTRGGFSLTAVKSPTLGELQTDSPFSQQPVTSGIRKKRKIAPDAAAPFLRSFAHRCLAPPFPVRGFIQVIPPA